MTVKSALGSPARRSITLDLCGEPYDLRYLDRSGNGPTVVFLHGLGCRKEDVLPWIQCEAIGPYRVLAFDFPGCGGSPYPDRNALRMTDLAALGSDFANALGLRDVIIVGHSMGGVVGLLLCERCPTGIRAFVSVEGNLASEDCTFSRRAASSDFAAFEATLLPALMRELASSTNPGFERYRASLEAGASARAYYDYARETVAFSDDGSLLDRLLALPIPKLFIHGSENAELSYLPSLHDGHCDVVQIAGANHFPFHDNPNAFAAATASFLGLLPSSRSI